MQLVYFDRIVIGSTVGLVSLPVTHIYLIFHLKKKMQKINVMCWYVLCKVIKHVEYR